MRGKKPIKKKDPVKTWEAKQPVEDLVPEPLSRSKIGRCGFGTSGQNWSESPEVARKGRYEDNNKVQGDEPDLMIDTDVSEAV